MTGGQLRYIQGISSWEKILDMLEQRCLSLTPDGLGGTSVANFSAHADWWVVRSLSVRHAWSRKPMSYGQGGGFVNAFAAVLSLTPTRRRTVVNGNIVFDGWAPSGAIRIQRPGENVTAELMTGFDQVTFYIPLTTFRSILRKQGRPDDTTPDIVDPMWRVDPLVDATLRGAVPALTCKRAATYHYLNDMGKALAAHLLYKYAAGTSGGGREDCRVAPRIHSAIQFIEANLQNQITLRDMAYAAGQTVDRFRRDFKSMTLATPHQYLIKQRVDRASKMIASCRKPNFAAIALECGFADQSHLSTTFRRVLGVSPAQFLR